MSPPTSTSPASLHFWTELPPPYLGNATEDFSIWCRQLKVAINADPHTHKPQLASLLPACLSGAAFTCTLWDSLSDDVKSDYDKAKAAIRFCTHLRELGLMLDTASLAKPSRFMPPIFLGLLIKHFPTTVKRPNMGKSRLLHCQCTGWHRCRSSRLLS